MTESKPSFGGNFGGVVDDEIEVGHPSDNTTKLYQPTDGEGMLDKPGQVYGSLPTGEHTEPRESVLNKGKVQLQPMSPLAASATVVNLLLATGPFT